MYTRPTSTPEGDGHGQKDHSEGHPEEHSVGYSGPEKEGRRDSFNSSERLKGVLRRVLTVLLKSGKKEQKRRPK